MSHPLKSICIQLTVNILNHARSLHWWSTILRKCFLWLWHWPHTLNNYWSTGRNMVGLRKLSIRPCYLLPNITSWITGPCRRSSYKFLHSVRKKSEHGWILLFSIHRYSVHGISQQMVFDLSLKFWRSTSGITSPEKYSTNRYTIQRFLASWCHLEREQLQILGSEVQKSLGRDAVQQRLLLLAAWPKQSWCHCKLAVN